MPLVYTDDRELCFLIDTGASFNVLMRTAYDRHRDIFQPVGKEDFLIGMDGDPARIFMAAGTISVGGEQYDGSFGVLGLTDAVQAVHAITGQRIDGALGVKFLADKNLLLDFSRLELRTAD